MAPTAVVDQSNLDEELPPSKLGTKNYWDEVYEREVRVFEDIGDEGEVWFGESSVTKMRSWATQHLPPSPNPIRILECGSGNGTLLLSFLTSPISSGSQAFHLTGIDYSPLAAQLAQGVYTSRLESLDEELEEDKEVLNDVTVEWRTEDLLRKDFGVENGSWELVLDKGTFDALALSQDLVDEEGGGGGGGRLPSSIYPERISRLVKKGGFFLITSCNFTEEEIKRRWTRDGLGFEYHSSVPHKSYTFGGRSGTVVCTVAFKKVGGEVPEGVKSIGVKTNGYAKANGLINGHGVDHQGLYICIDCGGTKTDVAIADASGIVARAVGGTGNMAEVGLQIAYQTIVDTVLDAVSNLPAKYRLQQNGNHATENGSVTCPVEFEDVWVGISGCDTLLDQKRMQALLKPFFQANVPILNDAHLLGGALLTHDCSWGIAVIAGTGSVVIALEVGDDGEINQIGRRGGTGYLLGDDGSAFDLGRAAIRHAIDEYDEGLEPPDGLAATIRSHFGVKETGEVLFQVYDLDPTLSPIDATNIRKLRISSLSRAILEAYTQSPPDPLAARAVQTAITPLVDSIVSLVHQLGRSGVRRIPEEGAFVMGGGVIRQGAYRDAVLRSLRDKGVVFGKEAVVEDVAGEGALGLAAKGKSRKL